MADKPQSHTRPVQTTTDDPTDVPQSAPRLPHERDESSDSQLTEPRGKMKQAHQDLARGLVDTDRGTPADEAYQHQKPDAPTPSKGS